MRNEGVAQQSRRSCDEHRLASVLAAAQPVNADQKWHRPNEPFEREMSIIKVSAPGYSGALSQRKRVWSSDSMRPPGRIATQWDDPAMPTGCQSRLSRSSS